jgi:hypothetical protein
MCPSLRRIDADRNGYQVFGWRRVSDERTDRVPTGLGVWPLPSTTMIFVGFAVEAEPSGLAAPEGWPVGSTTKYVVGKAATSDAVVGVACAGHPAASLQIRSPST